MDRIMMRLTKLITRPTWFLLAMIVPCRAFVVKLDVTPSRPTTTVLQASRRQFVSTLVAGGGMLVSSTAIVAPAQASTTTASAKVTDKLVFDIKGLNAPSQGSTTTSRIVIGLFGDDAPQPCQILKQLASPDGFASNCKPRETRLLEREQLEANKVYNGCIESESKGVTYDLSQVWRVIQDQRIDMGSVSGKYIAREYPTFDGTNDLKHNIAGTVSVRRGNEGGFGFTIYPGGGDPADLYADHIVVGRVLEGMDVIQEINEIPVVQSSKLNYKALAGGEKLRAAPSRACRYGSSNLYCNEFKPLKKLLITQTGVL